MHLQIIHIEWVIMSSPLLERFIWKSNSTATDEKPYPDIEKHSAQPLGLFPHLKILGIFILTAHIGSNRYVKINWQKSFLPTVVTRNSLSHLDVGFITLKSDANVKSMQHEHNSSDQEMVRICQQVNRNEYVQNNRPQLR